MKLKLILYIYWLENNEDFGLNLMRTFSLFLYTVLEDLCIKVHKKLLNNSGKVEEMVQIPIKSDQISPCISNYEIK